MNYSHWTLPFGQCEDNISMNGWCCRQRLNEWQRAPCQPDPISIGLTKEAAFAAVAMSVRDAVCLRVCTDASCVRWAAFCRMNASFARVRRAFVIRVFGLTSLRGAPLKLSTQCTICDAYSLHLITVVLCLLSLRLLALY
jgi:hypothetical protein